MESVPRGPVGANNYGQKKISNVFISSFKMNLATKSWLLMFKRFSFKLERPLRNCVLTNPTLKINGKINMIKCKSFAHMFTNCKQIDWALEAELSSST